LIFILLFILAGISSAQICDTIPEQKYIIHVIDQDIFKDYNLIILKNKTIDKEYFIIEKKIPKEEVKSFINNPNLLIVGEEIYTKLIKVCRATKIRGLNLRKPSSIFYDDVQLTKEDEIQIDFYNSPDIIGLYVERLKE
jgi:hypothetical protein